MNTIKACLALMVVSASFGQARAESLMWIVENQSGKVFTVDVNQLAATLVGDTNAAVSYGGLGFSQDGTLFAKGRVNNELGNLYTVDKTTGAFTLVGNGRYRQGAQTFDIDPQSGDAVAWYPNGALRTVDLVTGATSFRVWTNPIEQGFASAFRPNGTLFQLDYVDDELNRVNIDTGTITRVGSLGLDILATSLAYNPDDNMLYTIENDPSYPLYRIDPLTGAASLVGNVTGLPIIADQQVTMATFFVPAPEPSSLVLLSIATLGLLACAARRRRR